METTGTDTELILVRHAQSEWNAKGLWQGHADPPLTPAGREQAATLAAALASELAGEAVTGLVCSDLQRARQTAEAIGAALGVQPEADPGFRELDVGAWSGHTREEIHALDPRALERFEAGDPDARPGGGETRREIRRRARATVQRLLARHPSGRVVVVCHLGFLRALLPGVEPANAECIRVSGHDALTRRARVEGEERGSTQPL